MEVADDPGSALTRAQIEVLATIERVGAVLSIAAVLLMIFAFAMVKKLRTIPNQFLVFASLANLIASVTAVMGYGGLTKAEDASLCQVQGFVFEWLMQSDPFWSLAMAVNVFLVFFCRFKLSIFRDYFWVYCIVCFGGPFLPAIVLLCLRDDPAAVTFGDSTPWCWVSNNFGMSRINAFYIPIWICSYYAVTIYACTAFYVYRSQKSNRRKTKVFRPRPGRRNSRSSAVRLHLHFTVTNNPHYTIAPWAIPVMSPVYAGAGRVGRGQPLNRGNTPNNYHDLVAALRFPRGPFADSEISSLCTPQLEYYRMIYESFKDMAAAALAQDQRRESANMAYLKTAFTFGFSVLFTWIPSSMNRLYNLTYDGRVSYALCVASACVLPLQGLWNAIIFFSANDCGVAAPLRKMRDRIRRYRAERAAARAVREQPGLQPITVESLRAAANFARSVPGSGDMSIFDDELFSYPEITDF